MPEAVGLCATDFYRVAAIANEAQERLMMDPFTPDEGWYGQYVRIAFNVSRSYPYIVTPQEVARIILMDVCKHPVRINNGLYEFLEFGRGFQPSGCTSSTSACNQTLMAYERETVVTANALNGTPQILRAYYVDSADVGKTVLFQGMDSNGQTVRYLDPQTGQSGLGEKVTLTSPFIDSVNRYSTLTGIQKSKTAGEVQIYQVDPTTLVESLLVVMQPGEQTASYRKYFVNGLPQYCCNGSTTSSTLQVQAMCKLDFVPAQVDTDYLLIASVPALLEECMSIRYGRMDTPGAQQLSDQHHARALRLLNGQLDHYLGKERVSISVPIFGSDRLTTQPV